MTLKSIHLLRLLKKAQREEDNLLAIDFDAMLAWSPDSAESTAKKVRLNRFRGCIFSTLDYLHDQECLTYDYPSGQAHISHLGWNITKVSFQQAIRFTVKDVIVPIIVAVAAAILTSLALR